MGISGVGGPDQPVGKGGEFQPLTPDQAEDLVGQWVSKSEDLFSGSVYMDILHSRFVELAPDTLFTLWEEGQTSSPVRKDLADFLNSVFDKIAAKSDAPLDPTKVDPQQIYNILQEEENP